MNPYTDSELDAFVLLQTGIEVFHRSKNSQPRPYCSLGIVFVCLRVAKIDQETIPQELGNMSIVALDNVGTHPLICTHHVPVLFGVKLGGQGRRFYDVNEHDGELTAFRFGYM